MNRSLLLTSLTWMLTLCFLQVPSLQARQRDRATPQEVTPEEANALEESLKANPDNLDARETLIAYYFHALLETRKQDLEARRQEHIFWLIEHHPESGLAGSPEASIQPVGPYGSVEGYQRGKGLWLQQVEKHPGSVQVVRNAALFVTVWDRELGRSLLEKALAIDPTDQRAAEMLAQSYTNEALLTQSSEQKLVLAQKAFEIRERALPSTPGRLRFYALGALATAAFDAGEIGKAEQYARELLQSAAQVENDWNYGNAVHKGNIVLGRIALRQGDVTGAKHDLLAAGETPGSPQLNSFGPNMTLAKELLEAGERDAVVTYLESCGRFWKMDGGRLQRWIATVKGGGIPDFGGNLLY